MLIDLHVHTSRYSLCGRSTPDEMLNQAAQLGLDVVLLTEHNIYWPEDELETLRAQHPLVTILSGTELTSTNGDDYLIIGQPAPSLLGNGMDEKEIVRVAHEVGNLVVLAHPYRYSDSVPAVADQGLVDGIECKSNNIHNYAAHRAEALAARHDLFTTCASDGHHTDMLGLYAIQTDDIVSSETELAHTLRRRAFRCHTNLPIVTRRNAELAQRADDIQRMVDARLENDAIREQLAPYHCTYTIINGIREGKDVYWPI